MQKTPSTELFKIVGLLFVATALLAGVIYLGSSAATEGSVVGRQFYKGPPPVVASLGFTANNPEHINE